MKSLAAPSFWQCYNALPEPIRELTIKNFQLWKENPLHPSLRFKPVRSPYWSARVGQHYRAVGHFVENGVFLWEWIGTHEEYNKRFA